MKYYFNCRVPQRISTMYISFNPTSSICTDSLIVMMLTAAMQHIFGQCYIQCGCWELTAWLTSLRNSTVRLRLLETSESVRNEVTHGMKTGCGVVSSWRSASGYHPGRCACCSGCAGGQGQKDAQHPLCSACTSSNGVSCWCFSRKCTWWLGMLPKAPTSSVHLYICTSVHLGDSWTKQLSS